jgi:hypothetical protein
MYEINLSVDFQKLQCPNHTVLLEQVAVPIPLKAEYIFLIRLGYFHMGLY